MAKKRGADRKVVRGFLSRVDGCSFRTRDVLTATGAKRSTVCIYLFELTEAGVLEKTRQPGNFMLFRKVKPIVFKRRGGVPGRKCQVVDSYGKIRAYINKHLGEWFGLRRIADATKCKDDEVGAFLVRYFRQEYVERRRVAGRFQYRTETLIPAFREVRGSVSEMVWVIIVGLRRQFTEADVLEKLEVRGKKIKPDTIHGVLYRWYRNGALMKTGSARYLLKPGVIERPLTIYPRRESLVQTAAA